MSLKSGLKTACAAVPLIACQPQPNPATLEAAISAPKDAGGHINCANIIEAVKAQAAPQAPVCEDIVAAVGAAAKASGYWQKYVSSKCGGPVEQAEGFFNKGLPGSGTKSFVSANACPRQGKAEVYCATKETPEAMPVRNTTMVPCENR
jgi:hypothetical protein